MTVGKITVVNLNPGLDWTWHVGAFTYGGMNRVQKTRTDASGKGINVCVALKNLGLSPVCLGFNFRENGAAITEKLDALGIAHRFITVDGAVRVNIKLYDESGTMTEINQPGAYVPPEAQEALLNEIMRDAGMGDAGMLVLSGSRPAGVPPDFYARVCAAWKGRVILDTEGEALRLALDLGEKAPYLIKPNLFELESTFNVKLPSREHIADFCRTLIEKGVICVCVSLGAEGAMLVTAGETHYAPALPVAVKALQGAGDAMVAGLVYGMAETPSGANARLLRCAMAAAAATITREGTQMCDRAGFKHFLDTFCP